MATADRLIKRLHAAGFRKEAERAVRLRRVPAAEDPRVLATRLVRRGRLTEYQAEALLEDQQGRLTLGGYDLLARLGRGGMGEVFEAHHRRTGRVVALKILPGQSASNRRMLRRFGREVEAAFRVLHPNVVAAFDAGEADGLRFLATDLVDGPDLARLVATGGPLPVGTATEYVIQAAYGLGHAHDLGIVHRDVKPQNMLLDRGRDGLTCGRVGGTVKVADFGLASLARRSPGSSDSFAPGTTIGTADYISPEQSFDASRADRRSDVYGLGATLWFLLAGRPMFQGRTIVDVVLAHRDKPAPSLHSVRGDVPDALDAAFRKMVAKRPDDRFASTADLIAALDAAVPVAMRSAAASQAAACPPSAGFWSPNGAADSPTQFESSPNDSDMTLIGGRETTVLPAIPAADAGRDRPASFMRDAAATIALATTGWLGFRGSIPREKPEPKSERPAP